MVMSIAETVRHNNSPEVRFTWGFNDGSFDAEMKHVDRSAIADGESFALQSDTPANRAYAAGYRAGFRSAVYRESESSKALNLGSSLHSYLESISDAGISGTSHPADESERKEQSDRRGFVGRSVVS